MHDIELQKQFQKIKLLLTDVDGVLTDGSFFISGNGQEYKQFHAHDGVGIVLLRRVNFPFALISSRHSPATTTRMKQLKVADHLYQDSLDKLKPFSVIKKKFAVQDTEIAYIGDDLVDLPLLKRVGLPCCVPGAPQEVKAIARYITEKAGGQGAVREVVELILKAQNKYHTAVRRLTDPSQRKESA